VTIHGNTIAENYYGVRFEFLSKGNLVYANRFDNCENAYAERSNQWSLNGHGNCWSDATGDQPYVISAANIDSHAYGLGNCPRPVDDTSPTFSDGMVFTFECCVDSEASTPEVFANDNVDGRIRADVDVGPVNFSQPGIYPVTLSACDKASNCTRLEVNASVVDTSPPEIILREEDEVTVECGQDLSTIDLQASVVDRCDPEPTLDVDSSGIDTTRPGSYAVVYRAEDASGNTIQVVRGVHVVDTTPPELVIDSDNPLFLEPGFSQSDLKRGIRAIDACEGELLPASIQVEYSSEELRSGAPTMARYTARDSRGNESPAVTRVLVLGTFCPKPTDDPVLGDVSIACHVVQNELSISVCLSRPPESDILRFLHVAELIRGLLLEVPATHPLTVRFVVDADDQRFLELVIHPASRPSADQLPNLVKFLRVTMCQGIGAWQGCGVCLPPQDLEQARLRAIAALDYVVDDVENPIVRVSPRGLAPSAKLYVEAYYYLPIEAGPSDLPKIAAETEQIAELVDVLLQGSDSVSVSAFGDYHGLLYKGALRRASGNEAVWSTDYINPILLEE